MATPRRPDRPERQFQVEDFFDHRRPKFLLWVNTAVNLHTRMLALEPGVGALAASPRLAGEDGDRQARGRAARGEDQYKAPGAVPASHVEPAGGAMIAWSAGSSRGPGEVRSELN